jgi:hypothetical protein
MRKKLTAEQKAKKAAYGKAYAEANKERIAANHQKYNAKIAATPELLRRKRERSLSFYYRHREELIAKKSKPPAVSDGQPRPKRRYKRKPSGPFTVPPDVVTGSAILHSTTAKSERLINEILSGKKRLAAVRREIG